MIVSRPQSSQYSSNTMLVGGILATAGYFYHQHQMQQRSRAITQQNNFLTGIGLGCAALAAVGIPLLMTWNKKNHLPSSNGSLNGNLNIPVSANLSSPLTTNDTPSTNPLDTPDTTWINLPPGATLVTPTPTPEYRETAADLTDQNDLRQYTTSPLKAGNNNLSHYLRYLSREIGCDINEHGKAKDYGTNRNPLLRANPDTTNPNQYHIGYTLGHYKDRKGLSEKFNYKMNKRKLNHTRKDIDTIISNMDIKELIGRPAFQNHRTNTTIYVPKPEGCFATAQNYAPGERPNTVPVPAGTIFNLISGTQSTRKPLKQQITVTAGGNPDGSDNYAIR